MPYKPHPCAYPGCERMVARKEAIHCKRHAPKTPEHNAKVAASLKGRTFTDEQRLHLSIARSGAWLSDRACPKCGRVFPPPAKPKRVERRLAHKATQPRARPTKLRFRPEFQRTCPVCGKPFTVDRAHSSVRFCSRDCGYKQRMGASAVNYIADMPVTPCAVCLKPIRWASLSEPRTTCSYTCKAVWLKSRQRTSGTNIERAMEAELARRGLRFMPQVPLCAVTVADFLLPETSTALFCDGDYWHQLPDHVARDVRQTTVLEEAGYLVCRFSGSAILADVTACVDEIIHRSALRTSGT